MLPSNSVEEIENQIRNDCVDVHSNVLRRELYAEQGGRWLALSLKFCRTKIKLDPDEVVHAIKQHKINSLHQK